VSSRTQVPVLSALRYTVSQGHTAKWPGTFSLSHATFITTLNELADWAVATGWKRLLFINSHFGNDASARVAVDQIRLRHLGKLQIGLINVFNLTPEIWIKYTSDAQDLHANRAETELMLHLYPELVRNELLGESDDFDRTMGTVFSYPVSQTSFNGVTGFPSHSNVRAGAVLFEQICDALEISVKRAIIEEPPLPKSEWEHVSKPAHMQ
jgi:creatinine amidohydrolase